MGLTLAIADFALGKSQERHSDVQHQARNGAERDQFRGLFQSGCYVGPCGSGFRDGFLSPGRFSQEIRSPARSMCGNRWGLVVLVRAV
jgi:hypothetical protein